eukprot:14380911-Alexandrium_andersonii.AAC.1
MKGPLVVTRFLESGELIGDHVLGGLVYHADPGTRKDSELLPAELVKYEAEGRNVRVLVEGDPGWE